MSGVSFGTASVSDLDAFYQIERECFGIEAFSKQRYFELLTSPQAIRIKAIFEEATIGFAIATVEKERLKMEGTVETLNVRPLFRNKGVGFELMLKLEEKL